MGQVIDKLSTVYLDRPPCVTTALHYKGEVWLSLRVGNLRFNNFWQCAGGKVEDGENPLVAAKREVYEETGLNISPDRFVFIKDIVNHPSTICCSIYYVQLNNGETPINMEAKTQYFPKCSDWHLFSFKEAKELRLMPSLESVLDFLKKV